jgi:hypothetical protein
MLVSLSFRVALKARIEKLAGQSPTSDEAFIVYTGHIVSRMDSRLRGNDECWAIMKKPTSQGTERMKALDFCELQGEHISVRRQMTG